MQIKGLDGMTHSELNEELQKGGKFIMYMYCFSIIIMTFRRSSDIYFVKEGQSRVGRGAGYTFLTFLFGWWGIPWGFIYTPQCLYVNLAGGKDVTQETLNALSAQAG